MMLRDKDIKQAKKCYIGQSSLQYRIMLNFLLPLAYKVVDAAVAKIPDDAELGEKLIDLCLLIVGKAVKLTKTTADDELFAKVEEALQARD